MAFGSGDYLYCSHSACRRRFHSERALANHYGSFHGRPTCDTCGKKLKKSGQVSIPSLSQLSLVQPDQLRRQHTCTLLDTSASLEDYPALDFVSHCGDLDYGYDTENAEVCISDPLRRCVQHTHHVDSMLTSSPHPHSLPRSSRGLALILLPTTLMVSTGLNSVLPHWDPSTMTTTTRAAALRRSRRT